MKDGTFVFDAHTGFWDASPANTKNRFGDAFIETFYAFHTAFNPPDPKWTMDYERTFRKVDPDWYLEEMFVKGEADMAILSTQVLMDFYHTGFVNPERNVELAKRAPERIIPLGGVDPRAPNAVEEVERQVTELGMQGFKWYTAEWRGESRGWSANDPMVFPLYEKALELGVRNHFFHKGPAVEPLSLSKFDVCDIDEPAWLYPDMNLIIDHCGAPRVEEFCWLATRCPNVYAGLAVVLALIHNRPLDVDARLLPDPEAEPLAVGYRQRRGREAERITFLSFAARTAVLEHLARRRHEGLDTGPEAPLVAGPDGRPAGRAEVARARRRSNAIIRAGSRLNVELCRKTGEFFREWGPPGSRFTAPPT
jgi:uncharacterized protein